MYHIRQGTIADIPVIQELTDRIWRPTYQPILTPEQIEYMIEMIYSTTAITQQLQELGHRYLIMEDDGKPIAFAAFSPTETPGISKLHKIYLDFSYQGKGAGKLLLNTVMEQAREQGAHTLELNVNRYNKAKQFYEGQGFKVVDEKDIEIGLGYQMNDFIMHKSL